MAAYTAPILVGVAGLAIDVGSWQVTSASLQAAVDKATYSAMVAASAGASGYTAAEAIMAQMGFPCSVAGTASNGSLTCAGAGGYSLTVNNPPQSGNYAGKNGAWEVIATSPTPLYFARMFTAASPTVSSRSVANSETGICMLALDTASADIHSVFGSSSANVNINCAVADNLVNSKGGDTVDVKTQGVLHFKSLTMAAGYTCDPNCEGTLTIDKQPITTAKTTPDPYASRTFTRPTSSTPCSQTNMSVTSSQTLNPGVYCGGLTVSNGATVTLNPGIYYMDYGSLSATGNSIIQGSGVSIILTSRNGSSSIGQLKIAAGSQFNVSAPSSAINGVNVAGMAVWQDSNAPIPSGTGATDPNKFDLNGGTSGLNLIQSGASTAINGVLYFPRQAVVYNGGMTSGANSCTQIVAYQILFNASASFNYPGNCPQYGMQYINGAVGIVE